MDQIRQINASSASTGARQRPLAKRPVVIPTVAEAREQWIAHRRLMRDITNDTVNFYRDGTKRLLTLVGEETPVSEVTLEDFECVLSELQDRGVKVAPTFRAMKAFLRWCGRRGFPLDPRLAYGLESTGIRATDENDVVIFDPKQLATLKTALGTSLRNRLIFGCLLGTGLRVNELAHLDLTSKEEFVLHIKWAKGRKHRRVPMSGQLRQDWDAYVRKERPQDVETDRLFLTERQLTRNYSFGYQPLQKKAIQEMLAKIEKKVGFDCNPHLWRHTYATLWVWNYLRRGEAWDLDELRRYMGHANFNVLKTYVTLAKNMMPKGYEKYLPY